MAAGRIVLPSYFPARDRNDRLAAGAKLYVYANETTTPAEIFSDYDLTTPMANPVVANSSGQFASIWAEIGTVEAPVLYSLAITASNGASLGNPAVFDNYQPSVDYLAVDLAEDAADAAEAAAAVAVAAAAEAEAVVASKLDTDLGNATSAEAVRQAGNTFVWTLEDDGAEANDDSIDNTAAINLAMTRGKAIRLRDNATYYFQGSLARESCSGLTIVGNNTKFIYNGANTTRDLFTLGDGTNNYYDLLVTGLEVGSETVMTGGTAFRARRCVRSRFEVEAQGQDLYETLGNNLWNGVWFEGYDNVTYRAKAATGQNDPVRVNGAASTGPKAEFFCQVNKAFGGVNGILIGGAAGGVYLGTSTFVANDYNVTIDQSLIAETNREIFCESAIIDVAVIDGIYINDPGEPVIQLPSKWVSSSGRHGVNVTAATGQARITLAGDATIYNNTEDGIRVASAAPVVLLAGGQIRENGVASGTAYGVNPTVTGHRVIISGAQTFSNGLSGSANYNNTYAPVGTRAFTNYADFKDITADRVESDQLFVDSEYGSYLSGGNPYVQYDPNDYSLYDRTANRYGWFVAGGQVGALSANGLAIGPGNDALLTRQAANTLAMRNGTSPQAFWVHNTYTDASNFEALKVYFTSNIAVIRTENSGTGTNRDMYVGTGGAGTLSLMTGNTKRWDITGSGHMLAFADNTYDIGALSATRPRDLHIANNARFGGFSSTTGVIYTGSAGAAVALYGASDGVLRVTNTALNDFGRLQFGGTTSAFPALKRSGAELHTRLADDSAYGVHAALGFYARAAGGFMAFGSADDVFLLRDSADVLAQRRGTNAQTFRVYNTYTDASNYERVQLEAVGTYFRLITQSAGTGVARDLVLGSGGSNRWSIGGSTGHLLAATDNAHDIGASGANRPRNFYLGTDMVAGGNISAGASMQFRFTGQARIGGVSDGVVQLLDAAGTSFGRLQFGGTTASFPALKRSGAELQARLADDSAYANLSAAAFYSGTFAITDGAGSNRAFIQAPSTSALTLFDNSASSFGRLNLGGNTSAFPSIKRSGTGIDFRLADDSALTFIGASAVLFGGNALVTSDGSHILAQRNGANAQTFRLYETYTDASNYSRLGISMSAGFANFKAQAAGTGTLSSFVLSGANIYFNTGASDTTRWQFGSTGHFLAATDNTYDVGGSGANRPRTGFFGTSVVAPLFSLDANGYFTLSGGNPLLLFDANDGISYDRTGNSLNTIINGGTVLAVKAAIVEATVPIKAGTYLTASLPSAVTASVGARAFVTDALAPTFGAAVVGGGAVATPVYSDGATWRVG